MLLTLQEHEKSLPDELRLVFDDLVQFRLLKFIIRMSSLKL